MDNENYLFKYESIKFDDINYFKSIRFKNCELKLSLSPVFRKGTKCKYICLSDNLLLTLKNEDGVVGMYSMLPSIVDLAYPSTYR